MGFRLKDMLLNVVIILIIILCILSHIFFFHLEDIKDNWQEYRCNPIMMPFSQLFGQDPVTNFKECIKSSQISFISIFLAPIFQFIRGIVGVLGSITGDIQNIRLKISAVVNNTSGIFSQVYGLFINTMIQFQRIMIKTRDTINKILATFVVVIHTLNASVLTGRSIMNGPVGAAINFLCFHPDTYIPLMDGSIVHMKDVEVGSYIRNGSRVLAVLKIHGNSTENPYYELYSHVLKQTIYVTGSHIMKDPISKTFKMVKDVSVSKKNETLVTDHMSCLITDDHEIHVGEYVFKDWEYF